MRVVFYILLPVYRQRPWIFVFYISRTLVISFSVYGWAIRCSKLGFSCASVCSLEFLRICLSSPGMFRIPCLVSHCFMFVRFVQRYTCFVVFLVLGYVKLLFDPFCPTLLPF